MISSVSNLCFKTSEYEKALSHFKDYKLELALSKHFGCSIQSAVSKELAKGLEVCSIQSPFYGIDGRIFESNSSLKEYKEIAKDITDWAVNYRVPNIVFGSPKQRLVTNEIERSRAIEFLYFLNELSSNATHWSLENNPKIYGANWLISIEEILSTLSSFNLSNLKLNLDIGATIYSGEQDLACQGTTLMQTGHIHLNSIGLKIPDKNALELLSAIQESFMTDNTEISLECLNLDIHEISRILK